MRTHEATVEFSDRASYCELSSRQAVSMVRAISCLEWVSESIQQLHLKCGSLVRIFIPTSGDERLKSRRALSGNLHSVATHHFPNDLNILRQLFVRHCSIAEYLPHQHSITPHVTLVKCHSHVSKGVMIPLKSKCRCRVLLELPIGLEQVHLYQTFDTLQCCSVYSIQNLNWISSSYNKSHNES